MQQIRRYLGGIALGLLVSGYAQAVDYSVVFGSNNTFQQRHDKINEKGSSSTAVPFHDVFKFNLAVPTDLTINFVDLRSPITSMSLRIDGASDYGPFAVTRTGTLGTYSLLAGNDYKIFVDGMSKKDGRYEIRLTQAPIAAPAPPVPEPAEWTLLLAGFMVIGFIARRRKRFFR